MLSLLPIIEPDGDDVDDEAVLVATLPVVVVVAPLVTAVADGEAVARRRALISAARRCS
jgi:hypothetical protein